MARLCSVEGCQKRSSAKGFCDQHYRRNLKYGSPTGGRPTMNGDLQRWLDKHVSYDGLECLIWPFAITEHSGYGKADYQGVSMPIASCASWRMVSQSGPICSLCIHAGRATTGASTLGIFVGGRRKKTRMIAPYTAP